ncbi:hypothetical protein D0Y65_000381 [Glycine soja]|uniref:Uncharacterized protein n=1 Tax=Glycine soja TaxID=3848 RepID=A0A445LYL5_GLYSO|nr:hypothetical protein D0Y65_000381 [Glycine soja]
MISNFLSSILIWLLLYAPNILLKFWKHPSSSSSFYLLHSFILLHSSHSFILMRGVVLCVLFDRGASVTMVHQQVVVVVGVVVNGAEELGVNEKNGEEASAHQHIDCSDAFNTSQVSATSDYVLHWAQSAAYDIGFVAVIMSLGDTCNVWEAMNNMIVLQHTKIKASFETSTHVLRHVFKVTLYKKLLGMVSRYALNQIAVEFTRVSYADIDSFCCGCVMRTTHGLPCACELGRYVFGSIPLSIIHMFWWMLIFSNQGLSKPEASTIEGMETISKRFEELDVCGKVTLKSKLRKIVYPDLNSMCAPSEKELLSFDDSSCTSSLLAIGHSTVSSSPLWPDDGGFNHVSLVVVVSLHRRYTHLPFPRFLLFQVYNFVLLPHQNEQLIPF